MVAGRVIADRFVQYVGFILVELAIPGSRIVSDELFC